MIIIIINCIRKYIKMYLENINTYIYIEITSVFSQIEIVKSSRIFAQIKTKKRLRNKFNLKS